MSSVIDLKRPAADERERQLRIDLAAAFRLAVHFNWHESVGNHFSAAVSEDGKTFLMNRKWMHFSKVTASNLQKLDVNDTSVMEGPEAPDSTAWCIHGTIHRELPKARVVLHLHPPFATALAGLKDPRILPIDQNTARFFNRIAYDLSYGGMADTADEGLRISKAIGPHKAMMMGNHGVATVGETVAEAFEAMYFLERACQTMILALQTGRELSVLSDNQAESLAQSWDDYAGMADAHFAHLKEMLDETQPSYKD